MVEFSLTERFIFILLLFSAVAAFIFLARKTYSIIRAGKPDPERLSNPAGRIKRVIREVFFQQRVVGGRRIAGIMHCGVFFGFVFFSLETTSMFLEPFNLEYLPVLFGGALPYFRTFMQIIAFICALCMFGLAFRRFVLVKISPDPKSYESGIVALLIILLMFTYIDLTRTHLLPERADWWMHAVIIMVFPVVILRSKHRHIFLAPVSVFLRKPRLWDVSLMNLDFESAESEDDIQLGLETITDIPWKLRFDFFTCVECKRCTDNCPAAQAGMELQPSGFILAGRKACEHGNVDAPVIGTVISEEALGQCTSCMACENVCPVGIEHSQLLSGAKAAQTLALGTGGVATEFLKIMTNYSNPFSAAPEDRSALIEELKLPFYESGRTEYLLWLGCIWSYNPDYKSVVKATQAVLEKAGVSFGVLKNETCCGHHSRRQGEEMQFQMLGEENAKNFIDSNVKKIVTACPHCLNTFKHEYSDYFKGNVIEVIHHSQLFSKLLFDDCLKIGKNSHIGQNVTYHDPCYLGRYEREFKAPRLLIAATGSKLIEMNMRENYSYCCGGGAAGFIIEAKGEKRVDQMRKTQVQKTGAPVLITSCPECKMMLTGAVETTKDLGELLYEYLEK